MALKDHLDKAKTRQKNFCSFQWVLNSLPQEDQDLIDEAFKSGISPNAVGRALRQEGHKVAIQTVYDHRNKVCVCVQGKGNAKK